MIKPPFNYTGNKNRLIKQFSNAFFPKGNEVKFLDLFGGGGTVSINVNYENITYNDKSEWVCNVLKIIKKTPINAITDYFLYMVEKYNFTSTHIYGNSIYKRDGNNGLKKLNEIPFLKLRSNINKRIVRGEKNEMLWIEILFLSFYSFNNDIRFNGKGEINIPIGKTDLNSNSIEKTITFSHAIKSKKIRILNRDFKKIDFNRYDFIYLDPPYLLTNAIYNAHWSIEEERKLREKIINYVKGGGKFVLSNVSFSKGIENRSLVKWALNNKFRIINIDYSYKASSYNRNRTSKDQEVIITNVKNI